MPVIYMRHFIHGTKVAIAEAEARYDEGNGWVRYEPPTVEPVVESVTTGEEIPNALISRQTQAKKLTLRGT